MCQQGARDIVLLSRSILENSNGLAHLQLQSGSDHPRAAWEPQIIVALTTPAFVRRGGVMQEHSWMRPSVFRHLYRMEFITRRRE